MPCSCDTSKLMGEFSNETLAGCTEIPVIVACMESNVTPAGGMSWSDTLTCAAPGGGGGVMTEEAPPPHPTTAARTTDRIKTSNAFIGFLSWMVPPQG